MSDQNGVPTEEELDAPAGPEDRITPPPPWVPDVRRRPPPPPSGRGSRRDPGSKMGRIRAAVQARGPGVTLEDVRAALPADRVNEGEYYKARKQVFPNLARPARAPAPTPTAPRADPPARRPPPPEVDLGPDWLSKLVKFACAVEAVGGVPTARHMLDGLEVLRGGTS